jgi:hypothetical protein
MATPEDAESIGEPEPSNDAWIDGDGQPPIPSPAPATDHATKSGVNQPTFVSIGGGLVALGLVLASAMRPLRRSNTSRRL